MHGDIDDMRRLKDDIRRWGRELGFAAIGFAGVDTGDAEDGLKAWLAQGCHGEMDYMAAHVHAGRPMRAHPDLLVPGTRSVILARLDYRVAATDPAAVLADGSRAFVSRYALGRDYHRLLRNRLQRLVDRMALAIGPFDHRVFADSAPVAEVELARRAGLGWRGKHSLLLDREAGSYFFLGEILTGLTLPPDSPVTDHCGDCRACIDACPTDALVAPKQLDARRCISYLTIEHKTALPESLRASLGNRIYGCDDCQLACPWNRFAPLSNETDFAPRHGLDDTALVDLFAWTEDEFEKRLAGSPIRRIGYQRWLRNLAVALGNAPSHPTVVAALKARADHPSELVREHVAWALRRHGTLPADS